MNIASPSRTAEIVNRLDLDFVPHVDLRYVQCATSAPTCYQTQESLLVRHHLLPHSIHPPLVSRTHTIRTISIFHRIGCYSRHSDISRGPACIEQPWRTIDYTVLDHAFHQSSGKQPPNSVNCVADPSICAAINFHGCGRIARVRA